MSTEKRVIRLEPNGPADTGLVKMDLDQAGFQSDLPEQTLHLYYEDAALGLTVGIWTTTTMQEIFGPYPGDEFMWVLEGQVAMVDGDGNETRVRQGETFFIRNAIPISWKQDGFLKKIFMTYDNPNAVTPEIASADGGVLVFDRAALEGGLTKMDTTDPFEIVGDMPVQRDSMLFTNDAGNMFVGMWDTTAFESAMKPFPCHEFVQMLEGEVTITEEDGTAHHFKAGDAFFTPMGTVCSWKTTGPLKKFYSILAPT
ncbi:MAG: DUF861 domain-containing protein [Rhodospirillales bacterium]|nr:DUF861 domain-containing protein [Rhodospirillales bacterium]